MNATEARKLAKKNKRENESKKRQLAIQAGKRIRTEIITVRVPRAVANGDMFLSYCVYSSSPGHMDFVKEAEKIVVSGLKAEGYVVKSDIGGESQFRTCYWALNIRWE